MNRKIIKYHGNGYVFELQSTKVTDSFDMGMCACLFGMCIMAELFPNRPALLCCDNRGSAGAMGRGACRSEISLGICAVVWNMGAPEMIPVRIEEVDGELNAAGPPSRNCVACEHSFHE